jgi:5-methyltetrahydrofolate--homocysteine methyltransferase
VFEINRRFLGVLKEKILVLDGAMGTMLEGVLSPGEPPEIVNLRSRHIVGGIHEQYTRAGADIIQTNTFGGNRFKLSKHGLEERIAEVNRSGVSIAKEYCPNAYVWASMGPTGELLEPYGIMTFRECYEAFAEQAQYFEESGADAISIETMADLYEMKAAVLAIKDTTDLPVIAHMTFVDRERTLMGNDIESVAVVLEALGVDLIGANCSLGPSELLSVVKRLSEATHLPHSVEPNAGMPTIKDGKTVFPLTPQDMGGFVEEFDIREEAGCVCNRRLLRY